MNIGFVGLGNVGGKLAGSLLRNGIDLTVRDLDRAAAPPFLDAGARYGPREWSPNIIRRLEDATGLSILAPGFPAGMIDDEPEEPGYEVVPKGRD